MSAAMCAAMLATLLATMLALRRSRAPLPARGTRRAAP
jgi:hypothetical protein